MNRKLRKGANALLGVFLAMIIMVITVFNDALDDGEEVYTDLISGTIIDLKGIVNMIIDPNIGYSSGRNSYCSSIGYWEDITAFRVQGCSEKTNFKLKDLGTIPADETDETKSYFYWASSLSTGGAIRVFFKDNSESRKFEMLIDASRIGDEEKRVSTINMIVSGIHYDFKNIVSNTDLDAVDFTDSSADETNGIAKIVFEK